MVGFKKQDNFKYTIEQTKEHKVTITYPTGEVGRV